jgi:uncharacterized protein (TIGR02246 family)
MLTDEDRKGIDGVRAALSDAIVAGDAGTYVACFTSDAFVMHQDTPSVQGAGPIREHTEQIFSATTVTKLVLTPVRVDGGEGVAWEVGVQELAVEPPLEGFKSKRKYLHVYERQADGTWKIAAGMSSND